jgi:hypothetical protein
MVELQHYVTIFALLGIFVMLGVAVGTEGTITGATVTEVSCTSDADCDDRIVGTEDVCRNPGTRYSICVNLVK